MKYNQVGDGLFAFESTPSKRFWTWSIIALVLILGGLGVVAFGFYFGNAPDFIKTISGVGPVAGNVNGVLTISGTAPVAGDVLGILTISGAVPIGGDVNGVLTISGTAPVAGDIPGVLTISGANPIGGDVPAVLTIQGVSPMTGNIGAEGACGVLVVPDIIGNKITYKNELVRDTLKPFGDPTGPQVSYLHTFGFAIPAIENIWRMGAFPGFFPFLLPGVIPGDGGQGDSGVGWSVPVIGEYAINAHCVFRPSARIVGDHQSFTMAINLGATTVNPNLSGFIPPGGSTSMDISSSNIAGPVFPLRMSVSAHVHAGCVGCIVPLGASLSIHMRQDHFGGGAPVTFMTACRIHVSRVK